MKNFKQIDGKKETFIPSTLDQILGDTGISKYKTMDENVYYARLSEMNKADLNAHAVSVGILPTESRERLEKRLMVAFRQYVSAFTTAAIKQKKDKPVSAEVLKILSTGR